MERFAPLILRVRASRSTDTRGFFRRIIAISVRTFRLVLPRQSLESCCAPILPPLELRTVLDNGMFFRIGNVTGCDGDSGIT